MLQGRAGIKRRNHCQSIAAHIQELTKEEQLPPAERYVTLSVEGNISAGKSTFLKGITAHCPDLQDLVHVSFFALPPAAFPPASETESSALLLAARAATAVS